MILGLLIAILAGSIISLQNIFNSKINETAGSWTTTTLVLGLGFLSSLTITGILEGPGLSFLQKMQPWYWFSGMLGVGVVICIVQAIRLLGPTFGVSLVLTSQLGFALLWDSLGWLGLEKIPFTVKQLIGVLIIVTGVFVFKLSGKQSSSSSESNEKETRTRSQSA